MSASFWEHRWRGGEHVLRDLRSGLGYKADVAHSSESDRQPVTTQMRARRASRTRGGRAGPAPGVSIRGRSGGVALESGPKSGARGSPDVSCLELGAPGADLGETWRHRRQCLRDIAVVLGSPARPADRLSTIDAGTLSQQTWRWGGTKFRSSCARAPASIDLVGGTGTPVPQVRGTEVVRSLDGPLSIRWLQPYNHHSSGRMPIAHTACSHACARAGGKPRGHLVDDGPQHKLRPRHRAEHSG